MTTKSDPFKETIKAYLDNRAQTDELFATAYAKENKSVDKCVNYIYSEVQKSGRKGFNDDEIYSMAVHYYDEDDIKNLNPIHGKAIVNHSVELTETDKEQARKAAIEQYQQNIVREMEHKAIKPVAVKKKEKINEVPSLSLFGDETTDETAI